MREKRVFRAWHRFKLLCGAEGHVHRQGVLLQERELLQEEHGTRGRLSVALPTLLSNQIVGGHGKGDLCLFGIHGCFGACIFFAEKNISSKEGMEGTLSVSLLERFVKF